MTFHLTSTAFRDGDTIPRVYTADGQDISPPLKWTDPPPDTRSFVLICDDPDAPHRTFTHWLIFNLPAESRELSEGALSDAEWPNGTRQGINDFGNTGYGGPSPPAGKPHRYYFKLYALDQPLDLTPGATKEQILAALEGHQLRASQLMGTYGRT